MITKKLNSLPYGQCHVEIDDNGNTWFFSYQTLAAAIVDGWLEIRCLCSATTRKQVGRFVREYCNVEYSTAKTLYTNNEHMNVETGEVEQL